ncbi:hypothetical protein [Mucilaginibacter psychrotolerans]|uniref:SMI1/KNR4 family protein n=1 Tax=Mucilaginibacter psychrotolerans TaxID=1524096 RepID=A0A4Y8S534_9SPHI|nr:hypothetical protein [Mucilaginibacter psychrotolerans]TFF33771.1 hypothetical protein E2R66_24565 [Mucilaginibacter psychrotolerans]
MEIELLQNLKDNPNLSLFENKGISLQEITLLESVYNNGNPFPTALREMLFLAGEFCAVFDFGLEETQQEMQEAARSPMPKYNREILRPFYVVDVYNAGSQFLFVYLDENQFDPIIYEAVLHERHNDSTPWIHALLDRTLSQFIDSRLERLKRGENPF